MRVECVGGWVVANENTEEIHKGQMSIEDDASQLRTEHLFIRNNGIMYSLLL